MKAITKVSATAITNVQPRTGKVARGRTNLKLASDAMMFKRREQLARKFISGEWGVELAGFETTQAEDRDP